MYSATTGAQIYGPVKVKAVEPYYNVGRFALVVEEGPGPKLDAFIAWAAEDLRDLFAIVDRFQVIRYFRNTNKANKQ